MSSSRSSSSNQTQTTDQRTTNTLNSGLSGDVDNGIVTSGNYGNTALSMASITEENDNSFTVEQSDSSDHSIEVDDSSQTTTTLSDYSDQSFSANLTDFSGSTNSGNATTTTNSTTNITDGGAFAVVNNLVAKVFDNNKSLIDMVGLNSKNALQGANDLAASGLTAAMNIKAGEQISKSERTAMLETGLKIAAVGGLAYVAARAIKR